jgi:hypothetical protein
MADPVARDQIGVHRGPRTPQHLAANTATPVEVRTATRSFPAIAGGPVSDALHNALHLAARQVAGNAHS